MIRITPDINVLVAASRADHPHHPIAREWLEKALVACTSGASMEVLPMVAAGFLRIVTNARVFPDRMPIADAVAFLDAMFQVERVSFGETGREWSTLRRICLEGELSGNDIPDAWIAAAVKVRNHKLVTFDRDFISLLGHDDVQILTA